MPSLTDDKIEIKLAVLEERLTTFMNLFETHVKSDQLFMEQIRLDLRGVQDWKIKISVWATIGSGIGGFLASLLVKLIT